jgi:hypothetical protein
MSLWDIAHCSDASFSGFFTGSVCGVFASALAIVAVEAIDWLKRWRGKNR